MTSTDDGKDLKSISTSPQKGKAYYIELYKNLEARLSSKSSCGERVTALGDAWRRICELCQHSSQATQKHLLAWLQTHTAGVLLQAEWQSPQSIEHHSVLKNVLDSVIRQIDQDVTSRTGEAHSWEVQLILHAQRFKRMISEPWGHPVLRMLLNTQGDQPDDEQIVEWLSEEKGVMLVARLRQLATAKCQDLALAMITAIMDRVRDYKPNVDEESESGRESVVPYNTNCTEGTFVDRLNKNADFTQDVWESLTDMEFVLLHRLGKANRCKLLVKHLCLRGVRRLIERLRGRLESAPNDKKLWKNAKDVAMLIAGAVVHRCMMIPSCSGVTAWALTHCTRMLLLLSAGRPADYALYVKEAVTARHLHTFTVAVETVCKELESMRPFVCELYIHTLTYGMNELQPLKDKLDKESEARTVEKTLCTWFVQLGDFLRASDRIHAECLLTAFSVHPSEEMYSKLVGAPDLPRIKIHENDPKEGELKSVYGSWAHDSSTKTNFVKTSETLNLKQTTRQANVLSSALLSEGEGLGLGPELCSDLASLLGGPRVKTLSWDMDRDILLENCRTYMERTGGGTKSLVTELKYLNLDPSEVEHLPEEDEDENDIYYGIEKGYEHLVEFQDSPEALWEDSHALLFPSTDEECNESVCSTSSYYDYDIGTKKTHKKKLYPDKDCDPLCLNTEDKKKERSRSKDKIRNEIKKEERSQSKDKQTHKDKSTHKSKRKSKERSRERRKDRSLSKEKASKKSDDKKRHHKKEEQLSADNIDKTATSSSLSGLIGMKVCSLFSDSSQTDIKKKICKKKERRRLEKAQKRKLKEIKKDITDSDYDSQGKSSLTSLATTGTMDSDVLLDGFFSIDETCSPEKNLTSSSFTSQPTTMSLVNSHELSMTNGSFSIKSNVDICQGKPLDVLSKSDSSNSLIKTQSSNLIDTQSATTNLNPVKEHKPCERQPTTLNMVNQKEKRPFMVHVNTPIDTPKESKTPCTVAMKTDVKSTVARLIEFRKQKNTNVGKTTTMNVKVLDPHNVYKNLNKTQAEIKSLAMSSDNVAVIPTMTEADNTSHTRMPVTTVDRDNYATYLSKLYPQLQLNPVVRDKRKNVYSPRIVSSPSTSIKNSPNVSSEKSVNQTSLSKGKSTNYDITLANAIQKGAISINKSQQVSLDKRQQIISDAEQSVKVSGNVHNLSGNVMKQKSIQDFVKELQETINAGTCGTKKSSCSFQNTIQTVQCAKISQKKVDDAPNTFARLCYMHKNKQSDAGKLKQPVVNTPVPILENKPIAEQCPVDHKLSKLKTLQTRGHLTVSLLNNPKSSIKGSADLKQLQKTKISDTASEVTPILSTLLTNSNTNPISNKPMNTKSLNINVQSPTYDTSMALTQTMIPSPQDQSALSISDQLELQRLLWQRNKLNANIVQTIKTKPDNAVAAKSNAISHNIVHPFYGLNTGGTESINNSLLIQNRPSAIVQNNYQKTVSHCMSNISQSNIGDSSGQSPQCDTKPKIVRKPRHISSSIQIPKKTVHIQEVKNDTFDSASESNTSQKKQTSIDRYRNECKLKSNSKNFKVYEVQQDWESVLNELLSHQTPSRGENALDLKLRKDYIREKTKRKMNKDDVTNQRIIKTNTNTRLLENKSTVTKSGQTTVSRSSKIPSASQIHTMHSSNYSLPVSGVDGPLLDEEIDKDLLREIDELTSDEESYPNSQLSRSKQYDALKLDNKGSFNESGKTLKYVSYARMKKGIPTQSKEFKKQGKFMLKIDSTKSAMTQPQSCLNLLKSVEVASLPHNSKLSVVKRVQQQSDRDEVGTKSLSKIMTPCRTVDKANVSSLSGVEKPRPDNTLLSSENLGRKIELNANNDLKDKVMKNDDSLILLQATSTNICLPLRTAEAQKQLVSTNCNQMLNQYILNSQVITQPKILYCSDIENDSNVNKFTKNIVTSDYEIINKRQVSSLSGNLNYHIPPTSSNSLAVVANVRNVPLNILVTPLIQNTSNFNVTKCLTSKEIDLKSDNRTALSHTCYENNHHLNISECRVIDDNKHIKHQTGNIQDSHLPKVKEPVDNYKYKENQSKNHDNKCETKLKTLSVVDDCKHKKCQTKSEENIHQSTLTMSQTFDEPKKYEINNHQNIHQPKLKVAQPIYNYKTKEHHTTTYKNIDQVNVNPSLPKDNYRHKKYQMTGNENIHQSVSNKQLLNETKFNKSQTTSHGCNQSNQSRTKEPQTISHVDYYREKEFQISNHKSCHESKMKAVQSADNFKIFDYQSSDPENQSRIKTSDSSDISKHVEYQKDNRENVYYSKINVHQVIDNYIRKKYQASSCESVFQERIMKTQASDVNKHKDCHNNFSISHPKSKNFAINENKPEEYQICHVDSFCKLNTKVNSDKGKQYQTCHVDSVSKINVKEVANDNEEECKNVSSEIKRSHTISNTSDNEIPNCNIQSAHESKIKEINLVNIQDDKQKPLNVHVPNIKSPLIVISNKSKECQNIHGDDIHQSKVKEIQDINKQKEKECQTSINMNEAKVNNYQLIDNNIGQQYLSDVGNVSQIESIRLKAKDIKEHEQSSTGLVENEQIIEAQIGQNDKEKNHQNSLENIDQLELKECPDIENGKNNRCSTSQALCVISNKLDQNVNITYFLDTLIDRERLKSKRLSIMNREINKKCYYPPIPLKYDTIGKSSNINLVNDSYSQKSLVLDSINTKTTIEVNSNSKNSETGCTPATKNQELSTSNNLLDDKTFSCYGNLKSPLNKEIETPINSYSELKNVLNNTPSNITEGELTNENVIEKSYSQPEPTSRILLRSSNKINVKNIDKKVKKATLKSSSQIAKERIKMFKIEDKSSHCTIENIDNPTKSNDKNPKLKRTSTKLIKTKKNNLSTVKGHPYVHKKEDISKIDKPQQTSVAEENSILCTHANSDAKTEDTNDLSEISVKVCDENKHAPDTDKKVTKKPMTAFEFIDIEEEIQCSKIPKVLCPSEPIVTNTDVPCTKRKRRTKVKSVKVRNNGEDKNADKSLSNSPILSMENGEEEPYELSNESSTSLDILLCNNPLPVDNDNMKNDKLNENTNHECHSGGIHSKSDRDSNLICESSNVPSTTTETLPFNANNSNNNESKKINKIHETGVHVNQSISIIDSRTDKTLPLKYLIKDDNNSTHHTQQLDSHKKTQVKNISLCTSKKLILNKNLKHRIQSSSSINKKNITAINTKKHPKDGRQSNYKKIGGRKIMANVNDSQNVRTKRTHESNSIQIIKSSSNAAKIVLPNGRTFKATVIGNTDFNVDELLSNPNLRRKISDQIRENKKYTLNIKSFPKIRTRRGSKYMEATVKSVDEHTLRLPIVKDIETVNLISDDEDEQDTCDSYVTEFGTYKVSPVKKSVSLMHQNKFSQKSLIRLEHINFASSSPCLSKASMDSKEKAIDPVILDLTVSSDDEENMNFGSKDLSSAPISTFVGNESVKDDVLSKTSNIDIMSNCNKGTSFFENCDSLSTTCDQDVSDTVITNCNVPQLQTVKTAEKVCNTSEQSVFLNLNENLLAVSEEQSITVHKSDFLDKVHESKQIQEIEKDSKPHNDPDEDFFRLNSLSENSPKYNSQSEFEITRLETHSPITNKSHNYNDLNIKPCSVKILKCDKILQKIQDTNKRKCFVKLQKYDHLWEQNQSTVMKVDTNVESNFKDTGVKYQQTAEYLGREENIFSSISDNIKNIFRKKITTNNLFDTQQAYDHNSPVMEVFEILASYNCKVNHKENDDSVTAINSNVELQLTTSRQIQCKAEWCLTKPKYKLLFKNFLSHRLYQYSNAFAPVFHGIVDSEDILKTENNQMTSINMNISNEITLKESLLKPVNVNDDLLKRDEVNIFSANRDTENEGCLTICSTNKNINVNNNFSELFNVDNGICDISSASKLPEISTICEKSSLVEDKRQSIIVQTKVSSLLTIVLKFMNDFDLINKLTNLNSTKVFKSNLHNINLKRKRDDVEIDVHTKKVSKLVRIDGDLFCEKEAVLVVNGINFATENNLEINIESPIDNEIGNENLDVNGFQKDVPIKSITSKTIGHCVEVDVKYFNHQDIECKQNAFSPDVPESKSLDSISESNSKKAVVLNVNNRGDTKSVKNASIISDNIKEIENELQGKVNYLNSNYNDAVNNLIQLKSVQATTLNFGCNNNSQDDTKGVIYKLDENKATSDEKRKTSSDFRETVLIRTESSNLCETRRQDCLRLGDMDTEDATSASLNIIESSEYQFRAENEQVLGDDSELTITETDVQENNSENSDALSSPVDVPITPNKITFNTSENILNDSCLKYPDHEYMSKLSSSATLSETIVSKYEQNDSNNSDLQDECEELDTVTVETTYSIGDEHDKSDEEVYSCYDVITIQIDDEFEDEIISTFLACSPNSENKQHIMTNPNETTLCNNAENPSVSNVCTEKALEQSNLSSLETYNYFHNICNSKAEEINNSVMISERNINHRLLQEEYVTPIPQEEDNERHNNILNTKNGSKMKSTSKELLDNCDSTPEYQNKVIISVKAQCFEENFEETAKRINHEVLKRDSLPNEQPLEKVKIGARDENVKDTITHRLISPLMDTVPCKETPIEQVKEKQDISKIVHENFSESAHSDKIFKGEERQSSDRAMELRENVLGNDVDAFSLKADTGFKKDQICLDNNQENVTVIGNIKGEDEKISKMLNNNNFNSTVIVHGMALNSESSDELLDVIPPNKTYSISRLKRKNETRLIGTNIKKFRKGKNIDIPKFSKSSIQSTSYKKQFNNLSNYSSSLKFSYYQFFGRGYCEIKDLKIENWPLTSNWNSNCSSCSQNENGGSLLFTEYDKCEKKSISAMSLTDEMSVEQLEKDVPLFETNENVMNMGFGEESGRVILNSTSIINTTKRSAATLSDVKRSQPCPPSEDYKNNKNITKTIPNIDKSIIDNDKVMYLRLAVKKFFENMKINEDFFNNNGVVTKHFSSSAKLCRMLTNVPGLYGTEFIRPHITEQIVQVVQVGQLPVSAAAQNPVSCDSRVSQSTDASPSQCSVENSPHSGINDNEQTNMAKTNEYTELTTADLSMPIVQDIDDNADQTIGVSQNSNIQPLQNVHIEINDKTEESENIEQVSQNHCNENNVDPTIDAAQVVHNNNIDYRYDNTSVLTSESSVQLVFNASAQHNMSEQFIQQKQENGSIEKNDQIANAMNAAGIATTNTRAHTLVNILSQKIIRPATVSTAQTTTNSYSKTTSINAMAIQQALAQILPPPLNQTSNTENAQSTPQVLHIVQGKNATGNQITLLDNSQQSVISSSNTTQVLHIVQNKNATGGTTSNGAQTTPPNSFSGLSLVDASLPPGGSQLLHIVNTGNNQKNNNTGQLLKRVNLLTNIANVQNGNEQKMVQFVCKSADGKAIQLNAPHQRSMVLRLQPIERPSVTPKQGDTQAESPTNSIVNSLPPKDTVTTQQEIKSRSVYEENYAKFIQSSSKQPVVLTEKSTTLPKFNQAFGKPVFQDGVTLPKHSDISASNHITVVNNTTETTECTETAINLDHIGQISSPPLLLRKPPAQTSQPQPNIVQQIKQTISPMNIQTMHGGVIYTRQIPVNIGGGQTINLITVPSTELIDESAQKQSPDVKFVSQGEIEPSIIKIVPQSQTSNEESASEDNGQHSNVNNDCSSSQTQPVLTQMRIKLPMLSKTPQVPGARMVRPSLFQIQRNVIGGANQPVYQQLVLTAAPPLGQQTIRLPQSQVTTRQIKVPTDNQTESQLSSSTLEQLREFDMVLEQVKERSTVHPGSGTNTFNKLHTSPSGDTTDSSASASTVTSEHPQQVLYSIGGAQALNVTYVTRKPAITTPTTVAYVRSPDSTGIADSPSPQIAQNVPDSPVEIQHKPTKINSKSTKSRPSKPSSTPPNSLKVAPVPPKTSAQKPLEDEQTTQRILYILAEYKEQVENSPDKDKPAPRRRSNPPSNPSGSSKRKKSSSGSRRPGGNGRDSSPVTSEDPGRTMGSEDSSCGTSQGDCNENCGADTLSPQDSPRKVARKLPFEQESAPATPAPQTRPQPQRNVIVADGQTIAVARGAAGKPATAVLMPANYILPVSMVKGGQQIAIVTNRGPKLLTVGATGAGAESGAANALLLQRLIGPAGLKPMLTRPGVRHVRLPTTALHNLQAFNLTAAAPSQPAQANEPAASPVSASVPTPPEPQDSGQPTDSWQERDRHVDAKNVSEASPEGADAWRLPSAPDPHDYTYDEPAHHTGIDRPVLDSLPDRYSPDMEAQRIFDKMFDVSDAKKSYIVEAHDAVSPPRVGHAYGIDAAHDCHDKGYPQVVNKKDANGHPGGGEVSGGTLARASLASAAALRHKYAMLEHELRLQKSLSEECEDLGVDSPSASELFPEADLLFAASPAHDHGHDNTHTSQSTLMNQSGVPQPDLEDQIATDHLLPEASPHGVEPDLVECSPTNDLESGLSLGDVGVVTVSALNHEEFARSHPNTTFHSEPTDDVEVQPFSMSSLKGRHITSTIFHSGTSAPTTVLMTAAAANAPLKYTDIDNVIDSMAGAELGAGSHGLTRFDNMLSDTRELHLGSGSALHAMPAGAAAHVIRRVCYDNDKSAAARYLLDEPDTLIAGDDPKISVVEDSSRDATLESIADDDRSSPERHAELFWESNSASERSESRRPLDFSSDSDKCCKSPSLDETNSTDSSGLGARLRLDTVIKEARGRRRSGSADGSSADDAAHPPVRTYPAKRPQPSLTGKTRAGDPPHQPQHTVRRRASGRGVVKRGCHCCNGSPAPPHHTSIGIAHVGAGPPRPKKPRTRRPPATTTATAAAAAAATAAAAAAAAAIGNVPSEH